MTLRQWTSVLLSVFCVGLSANSALASQAPNPKKGTIGTVICRNSDGKIEWLATLEDLEAQAIEVISANYLQIDLPRLLGLNSGECTVQNLTQGQINQLESNSGT